MGMSGYLQTSAAVAPRKHPPIPAEQETGWAGKTVLCLCWEANRSLSEVQFVAYSFYTDYAILASYTYGRYSLCSINVVRRASRK